MRSGKKQPWKLAAEEDEEVKIADLMLSDDGQRALARTLAFVTRYVEEHDWDPQYAEPLCGELMRRVVTEPDEDFKLLSEQEKVIVMTELLEEMRRRRTPQA